MGILANENAISSGGYQISNSLRFQSASSQYATRTPGSSGNNQKFTWSGWVKRGTLGVEDKLFAAATGTSNSWYCMFGDSVTDTLTFGYYNGTSAVVVRTNAVYRDPSAWYHIVVAVDTTQATASNRVLIYVNGSQVTSFSTATYPTLNQATHFNTSGTPNYLGITTSSTSGSFDGYMTEINFIDGQQLTPSSFGASDPLTGQWCAAKYTGTYGTNGFYLPFSNGTSTTTLGADSSGNGNNWTLTNFTRSAGVSDCWMYDVPSGNGGASGTQPNSNYSDMNPLWGSGTNTFSYANLRMSPAGSASYCNSASTIAAPATGYWYAEFTMSANVPYGGGNNTGVGIVSALRNTLSTSTEFGGTSDSYCYQDRGLFRNNGTTSQTAATYATNDVIGIALGNGKLWWSKNGVWQGTGSPDPATATSPAYSGLTGDWYFGVMTYSSPYGGTVDCNFGQRSFSYTPPSGFKALCTANLPVATIKQGNKYMDATTYTGTGATATITNAGSFEPDFLWIKQRSTGITQDHTLWDTNRGVAGGFLVSNSTAATAYDGGGVTAFNSNGWTMGASNGLNQSGKTFVAWQWNAGNGTNTSNTNGSITSTVSVNATAGFSIVTYTGTGANATVGHGLGVAPKMVIYKLRSTTSNWFVYHSSLPSAAYYLTLDSTAAQANAINVFNSTAPTSSVFSIGNAFPAANFVSYCFAEIAGFSKFGSFTGNGSADGSFVYLGFRPKYVMVKVTSTTGDWFIWDSTRNTYNVVGEELYAESSAAAASGTSLDFLSNGFKMRTANSGKNGSSENIIYMAFAENPFASSNAR